jgi:hypothetical protein
MKGAQKGELNDDDDEDDEKNEGRRQVKLANARRILFGEYYQA